MNNPVTKALLEQVDDPSLEAFIMDWEAFESLALSIYRQKGSYPQDRSEFLLVRQRLRRAYPRWKSALTPYWRGAKLDGLPLSTDPFEKLLVESDPSQFVKDWQLIRLLPEVRETLNLYLISLQNADNSME